MLDDFPFSIIIEGIDKITAPLAKVQRQIANVSKSAQNLGRNLTFGVTLPVIGLGTFAVSSFLQQADAIDQVNARLKMVGDTAGVTFDQLSQAAQQFQRDTLFGDEQILRDVSTQLLTFTNITGKELMKAQEAILDVATVTKQDLKSTAIQLGKALNDPVANLGALGRTGIQFSEQQKKVIKALSKSGRLAEAQALILEELKNQYGGAAKAAGDTNPYIKFSNTLGDIAEEFGQIIHEMLIPLMKVLVKVGQYIQDMPTPMKKLIVVIGAVAAAIGPLLFVFGSLGLLVSGAMTFFTSLAGVLTAIPAVIGAVATAFGFLRGVLIAMARLPLLLNPLTLWIAGIGLAAFLVIKYWKPISTFFRNLWDGIAEKFAWARDKLFGIWDDIKSSIGLGDKTEFSVTNRTVPPNFANATFTQGDAASKGFNNSPTIQQSNQTITKETKLHIDFSNVPAGVNITQTGLAGSAVSTVNVGRSFPSVKGGKL